MWIHSQLYWLQYAPRARGRSISSFWGCSLRQTGQMEFLPSVGRLAFLSSASMIHFARSPLAPGIRIRRKNEGRARVPGCSRKLPLSTWAGAVVSLPLSGTWAGEVAPGAESKWKMTTWRLPPSFLSQTVFSFQTTVSQHIRAAPELHPSLPGLSWGQVGRTQQS